MPDVLLIEACDFERYPIGGQLTVAKQMMKAFGPRLALVGICTDNTRIGRWVKKNIDGVEYNFFAVGHRIPTSRKPFIPARVKAYIEIKKYKRQILAIGIRSVFIQSPQTLIAVHNWRWDSICYYSAGLNNPLDMPRYHCGKLFVDVFFRKWISSVAKADVILAAADDKSIDAFVTRTRGQLTRDRVIKFPTRVDTSFFQPIDKAKVRKELGIDESDLVIVNCGRINAVKGWDFLVDSFHLLWQDNRNARLIVVGDGEDRQKLQNRIAERELSAKVMIKGFQPPGEVVKYLNAADVVVVASYREGWSIALLEAIACGKAVVSTNVSGARDMIVEGENGFVVDGRDPKQFAEAMNRTLSLREPEETSLRIAQRYAIANLAKDLSMLWVPLA